MAISASNIEDLSIFLRRHVFAVPEYQRGYEWTQENIQQFHDTILSCVADKKKRFIGSVILMGGDGDRNATDKCVQLVDGQQRITTVFIYLSVLRDHFHNLKDVQLPPKGMSTVLVQPKSRCEDLLFDSEKANRRLQANMLFRELFDKHVVADPTQGEKPGKPRPELPKKHKAYTKKFRAATRQVRDLLAKYGTDSGGGVEEVKKYYEFFEALTGRLEILSITTTNQIEAMQIFTTMNTSGLSLSASDIVKGNIFEVVVSSAEESKRSETMSNLQSTWQVLVENLDDANIDTVLRHYMLGRTGKKFQVPDLAERVKECIEDPKFGGTRTQNAEKLLSEFKEMSVTYRDLLQPDISNSDGDLKFCYEVLQCMNKVNSSARILLLALFNSQNVPAPELRKVVQHIEAVVYRWLLAGGNAQELEDVFSKLAHASASGSATIDDICATLVTKLATDEEIKPALAAPMGDPRQARSILYRIHQYLGDKARFLRFDTNVMEVEHIAPKSATKDWETALGLTSASDSDGLDDQGSYEFQVEKLGNKTLLEQHINVRIKQQAFTKKAQGTSEKVHGRSLAYVGYRDSKVDMTQQLAGQHTAWGVADIELRNQWIIDCFVKVFAVPQKLSELKQYAQFVEESRASSV